VLSLVERLASLLLHLLGLPRNWDELVPVLSAGELETLIESGNVTGLMPDERSILEGVFSLRDTLVREVMVPRSGMVTLPVDVCFAGMMDAVHASQHARFPVIGTSLDDVRGLLDLRRLAEPIARGELRPEAAPPLRATMDQRSKRKSGWRLCHSASCFSASSLARPWRSCSLPRN
jgi:CBS domain containing-hemolysin-like protein